MNRLNEKVAVITGANSGIGKTTAELFAQEGAAVVLVARRADKLKEAGKTQNRYTHGEVFVSVSRIADTVVKKSLLFH